MSSEIYTDLFIIFTEKNFQLQTLINIDKIRIFIIINT